MLVQDFLNDTAVRLPDKVALVCSGRRVTYAQLDALSNRLANAFAVGGVRRGDRVAIYLNNRVETVVAIFGALKASAAFVLISPTTKRDNLVYILNNCRAAALVMRNDTRANLDAASLPAAVPSLRLLVVDEWHAGRDARPERCFSFPDIERTFADLLPLQQTIDVDLACLVYTSGSTGEPKGVMCDHSNMVFVANSVIEYLKITEQDIILNVLPLSFSYGLYQVLMTFKCGATLVLEDSFAFPAAILHRIDQEQVTGLPGVPTLFAMLLQMDPSNFDLSSLRFMTNAAAALPVAHITEILKKFPHVTLYSMYGLTETKRVLYLPPEQLDKRPESVGIAIPGTEVWIEDESGNRLGPGEIGELVVRGRHVMRGYWESPEETAKRFRPGPLPGERVCHTGDLFQVDQEGYFTYVGRMDDIIKVRGQKVAPKKIEDVLYSARGVVEAAAIAVPDPVLGNAIKAIVALDGESITATELLAHCRANLEDPFVPKYIEIRECLPKTASGKVLRSALV